MNEENHSKEITILLRKKTKAFQEDNVKIQILMFSGTMSAFAWVD